MDANNPITAALFSAFLKCPTKAHLMAIGEPAPGTHFADIEASISSTYKEAAKRRSPIGAGVAELLDFRELCRNLDHDAITHHVDCDTAVYDLAPLPHRPGGRQRQALLPSGTFSPIRFLPWDKPGPSDSLLVCFGALAVSQATGILADTGTVISKIAGAVALELWRLGGKPFIGGNPLAKSEPSFPGGKSEVVIPASSGARSPSFAEARNCRS